MNAPIIIIGSGFAAYQLVKTLRRANTETPIAVFTQDAGHDYNKPDLSHAFSKQQSVEDLITLRGPEFAAQNQISLYAHHRVTAIDTQRNEITANGEQYRYSKLVLATGASPFVPPMAGNAANKVHTINCLDDFAHHQAAIDQAKEVLIIGGGLIGTELAADLAATGKTITLVEPGRTLMGSQLNRYVATELADQLSESGVRIYTGSHITALDYSEPGSQQGRLIATTNTGSAIHADAVIVAAGLRPNIGLAKAAGLKTNRGICVDRYLQSSVTDIYALGDGAEIDGVVMAYLQPIVLSASALAKTLLGQQTAAHFPPMIVKVKTPSYPIQIGGNTTTEVKRWNMDIGDSGIQAKAYGEHDTLLGFIVTGQQTNQAFPLLRELMSTAH
ncbi:NADH:flavorubredoxin oxidoreductase [Photobacterium aquae]|uniref:NADH:flavorubredoxin oxidoreductase n=1 Tax=Photobacterium aquae TaxID=1195763 RepID=A0A0J1HD27_9GAMM|nr:NADH:flavorubredoxin reductase NorW [Photobacterium aquae]KLV09550.1 NADH:flavorubredoxin oxidoreductase [Photobacterium aquae]